MLKYLGFWKSATSVAQYFLTKGGPCSYHGVEALAFLKTRPDVVAPDIQWHLNMVMYEDHGKKIIFEEGIMPYFNVSRPQAAARCWRSRRTRRTCRRSIPNFFSVPDDLRDMREGLRISRDIISQKAFDPYRGEEYGPGKEATSDAELDAYIKQKCESVYHPVGTCKMGSDDQAVVDDQLRVHGVERLRVVDASIMPTLTSGNTNAPTIMIGEKASDLILGRAA